MDMVRREEERVEGQGESEQRHWLTARFLE